MSLLEADAISVSNHRRGCGCGIYYGRGRGRGHHNSWNNDIHGPPQNKKNRFNNQKLNYSETFEKATGPNNKQAYETKSYRCGMKDSGSRTGRTAKHLVDLYQASIKGKGKQIETNFICKT